ncbi:MAG: hypothetical protein HY788_07730 [Deltaproteobacteria bacterium]|nr:hypothetical protein [Deltaproteobacteria bacterium]
MDTTAIDTIVEDMEPEAALSMLSSTMKKLLPVLDEGARIEFVMDLFGEAEDEKIGSMVHL